PVGSARVPFPPSTVTKGGLSRGRSRRESPVSSLRSDDGGATWTPWSGLGFPGYDYVDPSVEVAEGTVDRLFLGYRVREAVPFHRRGGGSSRATRRGLTMACSCCSARIRRSSSNSRCLPPNPGRCSCLASMC